MNKQEAKQIIQKTKDDYNRIAPQFDSTRKYNWRDIAAVVESLDIKKGAKVLDLGCGGGRLYELLKKYSVTYTGVDISEELIGTARKKYPKVRFMVGDIVDYKTGEKFDYVFSVATLHHIPSKKLREKSIGNIKNALTDDGTAIISIWYFWNQPKYLKKIFLDFFKLQSTNYNLPTKLPFGDFYVPWKNQKGETLAQRYHHAWTAHELKKFGFKIVSKKRNLIGAYEKN